MNRIWKFGLVATPIIGVLWGGLGYISESRRAEHARYMLSNGVSVLALPTGGTDKSTTRLGVTSHTYSVEYTFTDAQGRAWSGTTELTEQEYKALLAPGKNMISVDARIPTIYDKSNPKDHGLKRNYGAKSVEVSAQNIFMGVFPVVVFLLILTAAGSWVYKGVKAKEAVARPVGDIRP